MAFDFTQLDGYREDMTADEKLALLDGYEPPAPDLTGLIDKKLFDKTASELAEWKRKHTALLSEEERKEAERLEAANEIKAELELLRKEKTVTEHKAQYLALGYDETLATETAQAFADGDMTKVFANQKTFVETVKKIERAAALAGGSEPPAGSPPPPKDEKEKLIAQYNEAENRRDFVQMQVIQSQISKLT